VHHWKFDDICHPFGGRSTSGSGIDIAIFVNVSHLFVDTFFELPVEENFAFTARITVILTLKAFDWMHVNLKFYHF